MTEITSPLAVLSPRVITGTLMGEGGEGWEFDLG